MFVILVDLTRMTTIGLTKLSLIYVWEKVSDRSEDLNGT